MTERLALYPTFALDGERWLDAGLRPHVLRAIDADGFARDLSNVAQVLVGGRRVPVVGTVSMDLLAVDLGPEASERGGEEVVIIGRQGDERITADEMARWRGSIPYEVTCAVSPRVARVHQG